ncbi:MAG: hypothetical protein WC220_07520 [Pedobacter sp.]|jgi:hypothetical protein
MKSVNLFTITILEMSGIIDKLKALKEKLQDYLPDLNPQGSSKKQLIYIPLRVSDQGKARKRS